MDKKVLIVKVGSETMGWIPSKKLMEEMRVALESALASDKGQEFLITHPFVSISELSVTAATTGVRVVGADPDVKDENRKLNTKLV